MISLRDIEREYSPAIGDCGKGMLVTQEQMDAVDFSGYEPFLGPRGERTFTVYGNDGVPMARTWRGWVRTEGGKHFCAALVVEDPKLS